eukprot:363952-Chlamydomonas_euryale.AAC.9
MTVPRRKALRVLRADARRGAVGAAEHNRARDLAGRHVQPPRPQSFRAPGLPGSQASGLLSIRASELLGFRAPGLLSFWASERLGFQALALQSAWASRLSGIGAPGLPAFWASERQSRDASMHVRVSVRVCVRTPASRHAITCGSNKGFGRMKSHMRGNLTPHTPTHKVHRKVERHELFMPHILMHSRRRTSYTLTSHSHLSLTPHTPTHRKVERHELAHRLQPSERRAHSDAGETSLAKGGRTAGGKCGGWDREEARGRREGRKRDARGRQEGGKRDARGRQEEGKRDARGRQEEGKRDARGGREGGEREARGGRDRGEREARGRREGGKREARGRREGGKREAVSRRSHQGTRASSAAQRMLQRLLLQLLQRLLLRLLLRGRTA